MTPSRPSTLRSTYLVLGTDPDQLEALRHSGIDHHGVSVQPFEDAAGDWPLRCCLADSQPDEMLAIVGWSPFPWNGAYRMSGPVVIHADGCPTTPDGVLPPAFEERRQILRCYDGSHLQIYDLAVLVEPGDGLGAALDAIFADPRVELVQSFNVLAGCWSFTAARR